MPIDSAKMISTAAVQGHHLRPSAHPSSASRKLPVLRTVPCSRGSRSRNMILLESRLMNVPLLRSRAMHSLAMATPVSGQATVALRASQISRYTGRPSLSQVPLHLKIGLLPRAKTSHLPRSHHSRIPVSRAATTRRLTMSFLTIP